ncbi:NAD kinase 2, mitochondrial isoform X2 [Nilaparvata lugens]|uniref:NAD kinase 2, mitochondrial isoform X2 n=1 Tax=Nilaparvata lugens TaxID=108931 RepID=UPI00193D5DD0|nr:NAD kinase 2, mitochondrial isoform X2 [Nilaparvata lugens]
MWNILRKNIGRAVVCRCSYTTRPQFKIKRALIVSKMTRYELEKFRDPNFDKTDIENVVRRGIDLDAIRKFYDVHKSYETYVVDTLNSFDIETRIVNRTNYKASDLEWCDAVMPVGGDGTFLLAASYVPDYNKPVIGFNSDPSRSEGHLCLPKKYSKNLTPALEKLSEGKFSWRMRTRIRITLKGTDAMKFPKQMHNQQMLMPEFRFDDLKKNSKTDNKFRLPYLALNEVFIGECLSARVSYFELKLPNHPLTKVKSSGLCICTGTGSTSWHLSMNRITKQSIEQVLKFANATSDKVESIVQDFNNSLIFSPVYKHTKITGTAWKLISK